MIFKQVLINNLEKNEILQLTIAECKYANINVGNELTLGQVWKHWDNKDKCIDS